VGSLVVIPFYLLQTVVDADDVELRVHQYPRHTRLGHREEASARRVEAVVRGELEARRDGRVLGRAGPGDLAVLASVLGGSPELFDATVTQPARVMRWRFADLQQLSGADKSLTSTLRKIAVAAIAEKLIRVVQVER
jgi:CRP-like cAMP-binding protein